jgi:hypothetical protein
VIWLPTTRWRTKIGGHERYVRELASSLSRRVYGAVIGRRSHTPTLLASFPVGGFTKFAPPGVGTDQIFVGGAGHVVGFGVR